MAGFATEVLRSRNRFLTRIAVIAAIGGFLFGYDTGVISGAQLFITKDFDIGQLAQQWLVGALLVGAVVGAAGSGYLSDRLGRKWTMFVAGCVYVVGALGGAFFPDVVWLNVTRFVLGLAVGTASFVAVEYISEQTPPKLRGGITSFNQLMITSGILVAYLVDYAFEGVAGTWRWMVGLAGRAGRGARHRHARRAVQPALAGQQGPGRRGPPGALPQPVPRRGRGGGRRDPPGRRREPGQASDLVTGRLLPLVVTGLALAVFQQLIGVYIVVYYSATILKYTGLSADGSVERAISVGATNVVFTLVAVLLLDRVGRRPLLIGGTVGSTLSLVGLGLSFDLVTSHSDGWIALVLLITFIASFAVGLGPVFWLMISEIDPLGVRSRAMSIATVANWGGQFPRLLLLPPARLGPRAAGHLLALRRLRRAGRGLPRVAGPRDEGPLARGDRARAGRRGGARPPPSPAGRRRRPEGRPGREPRPHTRPRGSGRQPGPGHQVDRHGHRRSRTRARDHAAAGGWAH